MELFRVGADSSWAEFFPKGSIIWRPVNIKWNPVTHKAWATLDEEDVFEGTERGGVCCKLVFTGNFTLEAEAKRPYVQYGDKTIHRPGPVCFMDKPVRNRLWTHLIVAGHTAAAEEGGLRNRGVGLYLQEPSSLFVAHYLKFRADMAENFINQMALEDEPDLVFEDALGVGVSLPWLEQGTRVLAAEQGKDSYLCYHLEGVAYAESLDFNPVGV